MFGKLSTKFLLPKLAHKTGSDVPMDTYRHQNWDNYYPDIPKPSLRAYLKNVKGFGKQQDEFIREATGDSVMFTQPKVGQMGMFNKINQHNKTTMQGPEILPQSTFKDTERAIHSVPDKFKGTDVISEAGWKPLGMDKTRRTTYNDVTDRQLNLFEEDDYLLKTLEKSILNKDRSK